MDTLSSQSWCTTGQTLQYELMYYNPAAGLISDGLSFFVPPLDSSSYYPTLAELWWLCAFPLARHFWKNANTFFAKNPPLCDSKFHPNWQNYGKSMAVCLSVCLCIIGSAASESRCLIYLWPQLVHPHSSGWEGGLWTLVCGIDLRWQPFMLPAHNPARIITCHTNRQSVLTKHWKDRKVSKHPSHVCLFLGGKAPPPTPPPPLPP